MRFAASSNEMFHLLLFAIGSNEFVLVAHDLVSGAVTANRHSHGDCQHPACIMLLGYHWADVLPAAAPYRAPTTLGGAGGEARARGHRPARVKQPALRRCLVRSVGVRACVW